MKSEQKCRWRLHSTALLVFSEMTEEEMVDLALRLSEQEASVTALQQQQEEADVMKAIQESVSTGVLS